MRKTSAWPLSQICVAIIVYASLYPFDQWRDQGIWTWSFLTAPWPKYWLGFDVVANVLGYAPLGFIVALALRRSARHLPAVILSLLAGSLLALCMETMQLFLPARVPSNVDFCLNAAGGALGAGMAVALERLGAVRRWSQFRADWFDRDAHGGLVLLALWPLALLYPVSVPFGLGQVAERLEAGLRRTLAETPLLEWLPLRAQAPLPLSPLAEAFCVALGLLAPLLMGFADMRSLSRRVGFLVAFFVCALAVSGLSSALTYGPEHGWAWITSQALLGLALAFVAGLALLVLPRRVCHALMLLCLATSLSLLNRAPVSPYFDQSLEVWEQGRFIRFYGLSQWLGWAWPYAALLFGLRAIARHPGGGKGAH